MNSTLLRTICKTAAIAYLNDYGALGTSIKLLLFSTKSCRIELSTLLSTFHDILMTLKFSFGG